MLGTSTKVGHSVIEYYDLIPVVKVLNDFHRVNNRSDLTFAEV